MDETKGAPFPTDLVHMLPRPQGTRNVSRSTLSFWSESESERSVSGRALPARIPSPSLNSRVSNPSTQSAPDPRSAPTIAEHHTPGPLSSTPPLVSSLELDALA